MKTNSPARPAGGATPEPGIQVPPFRPLRTWPVWILVLLIPAARFGPAAFEDGMGRFWMVSVFGPMLCCVLLLLWWLILSRASWRERLLGFLAVIGSLVLTVALVDPTMRGPGTSYFTLPIGMMAFGVMAILLGDRSPLQRTRGMLLATLIGFSLSHLVRTEGMTGDYVFTMRWRWSATAEDALARRRAAPQTPKAGQTNPPPAEAGLLHPEWPGFRGPDRSGRVRSLPLATNWSAQPPRQVWRIPMGPGWSSFAVAGHRLFTQEQRGAMEAVVCYDSMSGQELWARTVEARFDEPLGGPGPRATPTLAHGKLFTTGATGVFLCLNPVTGDIVWQADLARLSGRKVPMWGFSASPLVIGSIVIMYAGGPADKGVIALDVETGAARWSAAAGADSYGSPQAATIGGESLVLMLSNDGLIAMDPGSGVNRFTYSWPIANYRALQPLAAGDDTFLLPTPMNAGTRAIRVRKSGAQLSAEELWTSKSLKTDFSDIVALDGYVYGVDAGLFTCISLKTGDRQWKGGRYGKGQVLALDSANMLLVAAESGDVILLEANPKQHAELASFKALQGKTWNHPVLIGDHLYLRNSEEAACYQLPLAGKDASKSGR